VVEGCRFGAGGWEGNCLRPLVASDVIEWEFTIIVKTLRGWCDVVRIKKQRIGVLRKSLDEFDRLEGFSLNVGVRGRHGR
jgi:hypothetical protein